MTFGQIFKEGDVPAGATLRATLDGHTIPIQVDRKATHADGSLRHAVITVLVPELSASARRLITLSTGGEAATGSPVSLDDLLATSFDAQVSLQVGSQTLTASARQLLEQAQSQGSCRPWGKQCNVWLSGPQVTEWIVGGPLQSSTGPSPHLAAYFYIRAYAGDPMHRVRVNVVIENDWTWVAAPHDITYDATLTVGSNVYSKTGIDHYRQTRWHHVLWWRDKAAVYAKLDGSYIQASKAVSQYADIQPTDSFLDTVIQSVEPMGRGDQTEHMDASGAQAAIGPLPKWTTAYLLSTDQRAFRWMLANDDAASSYDVYYRDKKTGRPVTVLDYPYMTLLGTYNSTYNPNTGEYEAFPACGGECNDPNKPNAAHEPSIGYVSYMVTGDFYYLEQLQFWANWNTLQINSEYRNHEQGLLKTNQVRGQAWGLRTLGDVAYITPDDAPLKSYFVDMIRTNIAWYNERYTNNPDANKLGAITAKPYAVHYVDHTSLAPWQDDFFTWAIGHLAGLGFSGAEEFLRWKTQFAVDRMTDPGYCWLVASAYTLRVRDGRDAPFYQDVGESYAAQFPDLAGLGCNTPEMLAAWGNGSYESGEMYGFASSPTGYPSNLQPALAAAVDAGIANAELAWHIFANRSVKPDYTNEAMFAVVPRETVVVPAPQMDFYASPNPVTPGEMTTLHWNAINATSCTASWKSGTAVAGEKQIGPINGAFDYEMTCTGPGGEATGSVHVIDSTVREPVVSLTASPSTVSAGQNVVLTWDSEDADWCAASGGWSGKLLKQGQRTVGPLSQDTAFDLYCHGAGGDAEAKVVVHVQSGDTASTGTPAEPTDSDEPPVQQQVVAEDETGGAGAFGGLDYLWLLGLALLRRRRTA